MILIKKNRVKEAEARVEYPVTEFQRTEPTTWTATPLGPHRRRFIKLTLR